MIVSACIRARKISNVLPQTRELRQGEWVFKQVGLNLTQVITYLNNSRRVLEVKEKVYLTPHDELAITLENKAIVAHAQRQYLEYN